MNSPASASLAAELQGSKRNFNRFSSRKRRGSTLLQLPHSKLRGSCKVNKKRPIRRALAGLAVAALVWGAGADRTAGATAPEKIMGPAACADCHKAEYQALLRMKHHKAFDGTPDFEALQRRPAAKEILDKLGLRSVKREPCTTCHFMMQQEADSNRTRAIAGVSCESCHGAAKDWMDLHNNYGTDAGGGKATRETESPAHRATRLEQAAKLGMLRPDQPYLVAENCFQCHTVPNEDLVNTGGHTAGSAFELVSWAQGEVRHNFFLSNGATNREAPGGLNPAHHRRMLYVIGRMLDLEYSLRAAARATVDGPFVQAMTARVATALEKLREIGDSAPPLAPIIGEMTDAAGQAKLQPNNEAELTAAADRVKTATQKVAAGFDGSELAAVDALIPGRETYHGAAYDGK